MNAQKIKNSKNCPLCGKSTPLIVSDKLRKGESRKVHYCRSCDLGFLDNKESAAEIKAYYRSNYRKEYKPDIQAKTDAENLFKTYAPFQVGRLDLIRPYLKKDTRLLEIGCSAGMFLWHVKKMVKEVVGIDFDAASAAYAAKKCGCTVYTTEIASTPLEKKSFDVICMFQTLEHVKDPLKFLDEVAEYLKPEGILYVEVPNLKDILVSSYDLPYHAQFYYHSAHLYYFTLKSLSKLLAKAGFKGKFSFSQDYNLINHFNWVLNDAPQKSCLGGLSEPEFCFKYGVSARVKRRLNDFLVESDLAYKRLLSELGLASNLAFIGKRVVSRRVD